MGKTTIKVAGATIAWSACASMILSITGCRRENREAPAVEFTASVPAESQLDSPGSFAFTREAFRADLEGILALDSQVERYARMAKAAATLPAESLEPAMDEITAMKVVFRDLDLPILFLIRWMETDPEAGLGWMSRQAMDESFALVVENVFFNWGLNQPQAALLLAEGCRDAGFRFLAVESVLRAVDHLDPDWGRKEAQRLEAALKQAPRMDSIALLTRQDPDAAWQSLNQDWESGDKRLWLWQSFFETLASSDPGYAVRLLEELPDESLIFSMARTVFGSWAKVDPRGALIAAQAAPDRQRDMLIMRVVESAAENDPLQGLALAESIDDPNQRRQAIVRVVQVFDASNPTGALAAINGLGDERSRQMALDQFLPSMAATDPDAAMAWVQANLDGPAFTRSLVAVISSASQQDPVWASGWIDQLPPGQYRSRALNQVVRSWAEQDPLAAYSWASGLPSGSDRDQAVMALAPVLTEKDVDQAIGLISDMPPGRARDAFEHQIALQLAAKDPVAALEWTQGISQPETRRQAAGNVLFQWAQEDPESAFFYAMSEADPTTRNNHVSRVTSAWANQDPEAAVETLAAFSDRGLEPYLFSGALSQWIHSDEDHASQWLVRQAPPGVRDQGLAMLVGVRLQHDAPAALADALQIGNQSQRRQALRQVFAWSQQFDPEFGRLVLEDGVTLATEDRIHLEREFGDRLSAPTNP